MKPGNGRRDGRNTARLISAECPPLSRGGHPSVLRLLAACTFLALALVAATTAPSMAAPAHPAKIVNQARATYSELDLSKEALSNQVSITVKIPDVPATIALYRYAGLSQPDTILPVAGTSYSPGGSATGPFTPLPPPVIPGYPSVNTDAPLPLLGSGYFHAGDPVFIVVTDRAANTNPATVDKITVELTSTTGDREVLQLLETGPDTGIFSGYVQTDVQSASPVLNNGRLAVADSSQIVSRYQEAANSSVILLASALVDPTGRVFDSISGKPVNGVTITILDASGAPATVYGDDGTSIFPATVISGGSVTDAGGRRYDFPPGGYRFPLISSGTYRLQITPPSSYRAPSAVSDSTLQSLTGAPYSLSPASRGTAFTVAPGPIVRIDIPVDPLAKGLWMEKTVGKTLASVGDFVPFALRVSNLDANQVTTGVAVTDLLPPGLRYQRGSLRIGGMVAPDPIITPIGIAFTVPLGDLKPGEARLITFVTQVIAGAQPGFITNRAYAVAGGFTSNTATASLKIIEDFLASSTILMGTVTDGACGTEGKGVEGARIYLEDGTYVVTDRKGMFHFEGVVPGTHVVQLDPASLPEGFQAIPCEENSRFAGRASSQFVDLQGGALWRTDFYVNGPPQPASAHVPGPAATPDTPRGESAASPPATLPEETGGQPAEEEGASATDEPGAVPATTPVTPGTSRAPSPTAADDDEKMPAFDQAWMDSAPAGRDWVWPPPTYFPPIPNTHIALRHLPGDKVSLSVNGEAVPPVLLEKILKSRNGTAAVTYWRGVPLQDGDNRIVAVIQPEGSSDKVVVERTLHVSTSPVRAEIVPELSQLVADGKQPPVIAIRLFDKDDFPARFGVTGKYAISSPYVAYKDLEQTRMNDLASREEVKYVVGKEGITLIRLQPTNRTGEVVITFPFVNREESYRAWLAPQQRDWILVGLAEGTAAYSTVTGNMANFAAAGGEDKFYDHGRVAFFAKGSIQGKWLLTMSYDSDKKSPLPGNSLFQTIDPNAYYPLYGDNTQQQYDASSSKKIYVKIERDQFYALFGDFNTGLSVTELSRYSRSITGLKSEYQGKNLEYNIFATETGQSFAKDELRGDGTSGLYHLTHRNIVQNSDKIRIEVRDRFRSEIILSTRSLGRYLDYTIDYDSGTLFFKEPIASRDEQFNPVYIVVDYETQDVGKESFSAGGRVGVKLLDDRVRTGVSYIREGQLTGQASLYGVDASWQATPGTRIRAEAARTDTNFIADKRGGNAYIAELEHRAPRFDGRLYFRELDEGFGLGQQNTSESGTRKMGIDVAWRPIEPVTLGGLAYRQYNLVNGNIRDVAEGKAVYSYLDYSARLGLRYASDHLWDGSTKSSQQITMGGSWLTLNKKLTLYADHDQSIGNNSNADYPTRTTIGAGYKVSENLTLIAAQEFTNGTGATTNTTRVGMKSTPWQGGAFAAAMERSLNENSDRLFALFGLKQAWRLSERWSVDASLDRGQTVRNIKDYRFDVKVPPASGGGEDFTAISLGTTYQEKKWNWSTRVEVRRATSEDKWGLQTAFVGEPWEGWGWSARLQIYNTDASSGQNKTAGDLRLGLVYRPFQTRWIILDRLDLLYGDESGYLLSQKSRRIVNNLSANFKPDRKTQISLQYGSKYVEETIEGARYTGYTDLVGFEGRYDLTKEWDIGLRGGILHTWNGGQYQYSAGPSIGYNVMQNAWASIGYNIVGFHDNDFSAMNYTAQGPFIRFRVKFDQESVRDAIAWLNKL